MNKPQYVKVGDNKYKINTDFRTALECNKIAKDKSIKDLERAMAIIYKLFGEDGLNCKDQEKLLDLAVKYLRVGRDIDIKESSDKEKYELDFDKCKGLIKSSFKFDYQYDPYELDYLHWYDFYNDLENLSTSEFGTCCALNRIRVILDQDPKSIKDSKQRKSLVDSQKLLKQLYCTTEQPQLTKEQEENANNFYKALGIDLGKET